MLNCETVRNRKCGPSMQFGHLFGHDSTMFPISHWGLKLLNCIESLAVSTVTTFGLLGTSFDLYFNLISNSLPINHYHITEIQMKTK